MNYNQTKTWLDSLSENQKILGSSEKKGLGLSLTL